MLGRTIDDAAGEAFDKGARLLGLGYPGGAALDALAKQGDPTAYDFPRSYVGELDFSLQRDQDLAALQAEGAARGRVRERKADLAASYQAAVVEMLVKRVRKAIELTGIERVAIGGGVAANSQLRDQIRAVASDGQGSAARALHRQRRDDRARPRCGSAAGAISDFAALDAYPSGQPAPA